MRLAWLSAFCIPGTRPSAGSIPSGSNLSLGLHSSRGLGVVRWEGSGRLGALAPLLLSLAMVLP